MIDGNIFTCASPSCPDVQCIVERTDDPDGLWRVTCRLLDLEYLVALPEPLCPRCGEPMCSAPTAHRVERVNLFIVRTGQLHALAGVDGD